MSELAKQVDFGLIRYANCWEDADVLLHGLSLQPGTDVLCIASAGDNALSLLTTNPTGVHCVDVSMVQLYLLELKQMAFAELEYNELLQLLGVEEATLQIRVELYQKIRQRLSSAAQQYWDEHIAIIERGIIYSGKFENYFAKFRNYILPLAHNKTRIRELLAVKSEEEQKRFYDNKWNTLRFRLLMNFFFSKYVLGKYGRDPKFLEHIKIPVAQYIRQRTEQQLRSAQSQTNYFLHMIFTGRFGDNRPHYLREENFRVIKSNIDKLSITQMSAEQAIVANKYDAYCLSNIFEYISDEQFKAIAESWAEHIPADAKLAYWNLMAPRSFSEIDPQHYIYDTLCDELTKRDKGFFYSRFITEQRR